MNVKLRKKNMKCRERKKETENLWRNNNLHQCLKTEDNGNKQTSVEHETLKICEQDITNSLYDGDLITDQNSKNKEEDYSHQTHKTWKSWTKFQQLHILN